MKIDEDIKKPVAGVTPVPRATPIFETSQKQNREMSLPLSSGLKEIKESLEDELKGSRHALTIEQYLRDIHERICEVEVNHEAEWRNRTLLTNLIAMHLMKIHCSLEKFISPGQVKGLKSLVVMIDLFNKP